MEASNKAAVVNKVIRDHKIKSVFEMGCGDGNQLGMFQIPFYMGWDISATARNKCRELYANDTTKCFIEAIPHGGPVAEMALSLDVIFHLVDEEIYQLYMKQLFTVASSYVLIYSTHVDQGIRAHEPHVKHRRFTETAAQFKDWDMIAGPFAKRLRPPAPSKGFWLYKRKGVSC